MHKDHLHLKNKNGRQKKKVSFSSRKPNKDDILIVIQIHQKSGHQSIIK